MLLFLLIPAVALASGDIEEVTLDDIPPQPAVYILTPEYGQSYDSGSKLSIRVEGTNVQYYEVVLTIGEASYTYSYTGEAFEYTFEFETPPTLHGLLKVTGYTEAEPNAFTLKDTVTRDILSPKEELIEKMIALAYANSKDTRYKFAPAETDSDIGVCKNFVMRLFDTYSADYRMLAYPDLELHMPKNNSKVNCAPYDYGIEWRPETAEDGSPFEIVAQFKYNNDLTAEENAELAADLIRQIKKGDFFQIVGYYGGGNGPHSMYIIQDYNPVTTEIHWTDSNMRGKRIDGVRWGYLQYDASNTLEWWVNVFNMKKRGATLYRLRDDLYKY